MESTSDDNALKLKLLGSKQSPVHNPAFVIKGWGENTAELSLNDKGVPWGKDARVGHRYTIEGCDLIVWLKLDSSEETNLTLTRQKSDSR